MTFLNGALLAGAATAAVPLAIHLLHRSRIKTVPWGAMQLLRPNRRRTNQWIQWHQLLLLLVRMTVPVLLALCMSRPLLPASGFWNRLPKSSCLLLLDDSASMGASRDGFCSIDRAQNAITRLLDALPAGSESCLLNLSGPTRSPEPFSREKQHLQKRLRDTQPAAAQARISEALSAATGQIAQVQSLHRHIILFTDFQSSNWSESQIENCRSALRRLLTLPHPPQLLLYDTGVFSTENVSVDALDFPKSPITPHQSVTYQATIRNHGAQPQKSRSIIWKIDGKPISTQLIDLEANQSTQAVFVHAFGEPGSHTIEVSTDPDALSWDDSRSASILVHPPIPVLLVNGKPSTRALEGETDFVELALQPVLSGNAQVSSAVRPRVISPSELRTQTLSEFPAILLANTPPLEPEIVTALEQYARSGGGLLFFPGSTTDVEWSNRALHREGAGLLPASLRAAVPAGTLDSDGALGIAETPFDHPALEVVREDRSALAGFQAHRWFPLILSPQHKENAALVLAQLSNGDPLWVERSFGRGAVLQSAIPCSAEWSNFPARPVFVPIMQRLVTHAAHHTVPERNLIVGEPLVYSDTSSGQDKPLSLRRPDGSRSALTPTKVGEEIRLETNETDIPGVYTLNPESHAPIHFSVRMRREESEMQRLSAEQIHQTAKHLNAQLADSPESLLAVLGESTESVELWQFVLAILLAALFTEQLLQKQFRPQADAAS